jgi:hypothetical protein
MSHIFENREYLILPVSELTKVDFNLVLETSAETVRKSIDGTNPRYFDWSRVDIDWKTALIWLIKTVQG